MVDVNVRIRGISTSVIKDGNMNNRGQRSAQGSRKD